MIGSKIKCIVFFVILALTHIQAYAINPVQGWYAGVFLGPTYAPNIDFTLDPASIPAAQRETFTTSLANYLNLTSAEVQSLLSNYTNTPVAGQLTHSVLGGIGGQIGYRFCTKLRGELELLYNNNPFNELKLGQYTIDSVSSNPKFHIGGDTNTGAAMFNFFYDLLVPNNDNYSAVAPYVGVGLGYSYVQNSLQFHYGSNTEQVKTQGATPATLYEINITKSHSTYAGQVIIGISYFMDDFCWLSADVRYFATGKTSVSNPINQNVFESKTELLSAMIGFNGAFDLG